MTDIDNHYKHLFVIIEHDDGKIIPVSLQMLGEGRRLIDGYNKRYSADEKVVAILLGNNVRALCNELIYHGADVVIYADSPHLQYPHNLIYTKVISKISQDKECIKRFSPDLYLQFKKPRYMFFAADNIGRQLSSTVLAELESGLASDINKLVISDLEIRHEHKTKGQPIKYEKVLEMYRPDFSGFLWTTILCLDNVNPDLKREYHPQGCSIIPGIFEPIERNATRKGIVVDYVPEIEKDDLKVKILNRRIIKSKIDYQDAKVIVSFGRGIKDSPEDNIKLIEQLAQELHAEIGISLPISKKPYALSERLNSTYAIPDRVIGTSGRKVNPRLYIAVGVSGAVQHIAGMKESEFIIGINSDENAPIRDECDIFIHGRMDETIPLILEELKSRALVEVKR